MKGRGLLSPLAIESQDDLAVAARLEFVLSLVATANVLMVVDFAIDGQHLTALSRLLRGGTIQGLSARLGVYDAQSLVGQDGRAATIDATPVWAAMTYFLTHSQCFLTQFLRLFLYIQD